MKNTPDSYQIDFLKLVIDSLPHPFYVIDTKDYTVKLANSAASRERLDEKTTCHALSHRQDSPCDSEDHPCPVEMIKRTKKPVIVEHIHYDQNDNPRNVEVHAYPILDNAGNVSRVIEYSL
ncbi:MAG: PAS domain-containing protein, partial [Desulfobacterales bacterium]|nr:PAS domain-containing protein [Desulfobacterales bacterium]